MGLTTDQRAQVFHEALHYVREFRNTTFVICCQALTRNERPSFCRDVALLRYMGVAPVIVHPSESTPLLPGIRHGASRVSHELVHEFGKHESAIGLSGAHGGLVTLSNERLQVDTDLIERLMTDYVCVIEAVAVLDTPVEDLIEPPETRAVDADAFAATLAVSLGAYKVVYMVGQNRVTKRETHRDGTWEREISQMRASAELAQDLTSPPDVRAAVLAGIGAVEAGVRYAHIVPCRPHTVLDELLSDKGFGTKIWPSDEWSSTPHISHRDRARGYELWPDPPLPEDDL